jgi:hypothetical protein
MHGRMDSVSLSILRRSAQYLRRTRPNSVRLPPRLNCRNHPSSRLIDALVDTESNVPDDAEGGKRSFFCSLPQSNRLKAEATGDSI